MFQVILPNIYVYPNDVVCREGAVADVTVTIALIHTFTIIIFIYETNYLMCL